MKHLLCLFLGCFPAATPVFAKSVAEPAQRSQIEVVFVLTPPAVWAV